MGRTKTNGGRLPPKQGGDVLAWLARKKKEAEDEGPSPPLVNVSCRPVPRPPLPEGPTKADIHPDTGLKPAGEEPAGVETTGLKPEVDPGEEPTGEEPAGKEMAAPSPGGSGGTPKTPAQASASQRTRVWKKEALL